MKNKILITYRNKVAVDFPSFKKINNLAAAASVSANLKSLGYTLSPSVINKLKTLSKDDLTTWYKCTVVVLKQLKGAHVVHKPMYKNFPSQVMNTDDVTLYINAIIHYMSDGTLFPAYEVEERLPLFDFRNTQVLDLSDDTELNDIANNLLTANTSLSETDKETLRYLLTTHAVKLPAAIPFKETLAFVGSLVLTENLGYDLTKQFKTATDILRLATGLSGGDISLAENTKYVNFNRRIRRVLVSMLDQVKHPEEDLVRHEGKWLRLSEKLHVGEYFNKYPNAAGNIAKLRKGELKSFNSRVAKADYNEDSKALLELLKKRPSEFARRLAYLLRKYESKSVLTKFSEVAGEVSTPILLNLQSYFSNDSAASTRAFFPKGSLAKMYTIENKLEPLSPRVKKSVVKACETALVSRFKELPKLGKCFVDDDLKNFVVPFSQRSSSKSLLTISRGSRIPFNTDKTLRFFIYWKNNNFRVDLDLSAVLLDNEFCLHDHVSYFNLKTVGGHHSGDIVDAPNGASEFIDINPKKALANGARYLVMSVNSYTVTPYKDLPICFAGWMERKCADSGEIYEPTTVENKFDITSDTTVVVPVVFDLEKGEAIWMDLSVSRNINWVNNISANSRSTSKLVRAFAELRKPDIQSLVNLHVKARGKAVSRKEDADIVFDRSFALQADTIMSEYLK